MRGHLLPARPARGGRLVSQTLRYGGAWAGTLGLVLGAWLVADEAAASLERSGPLVGGAPRGAPLPAASVEALWAGPLARTEVDTAVGVGLADHPELAVAAAARPSRLGSAAGHRALAAAALDPALAARLRRTVALPAAELSWLTDPALLAAARARCPALGVACDDAWLTAQAAAVDAALADALVDRDEGVAAAALAAACRIGPTRGVALADAVAPPEADVRARAVGLRVRSCALGGDAAADLEAELGPRNRLAPVAALELWRVGAHPDLLEDRRGDGTVVGILAELGPE